MGSSVFNGLAHFIKGGIFFLYGIVTLGRWLGAFGDLGWVCISPPPPLPHKPSVTFGKRVGRYMRAAAVTDGWPERGTGMECQAPSCCCCGC